LVADIGASITQFYVLDRGHVRFMREVPVAGDAITKALTAEISTASGPIHLTDIEAEDLKITSSSPGIPSAFSINAPPIAIPWSVGAGSSAARATVGKNMDYMDMMVRPVVERISSEITRSIQFFQENTGLKVDAVFLTGGSAGLPINKTHIETTVPLPTHILDPFVGLEFKDAASVEYAEKNKCRLAVAVGLALGEPMSICLLPRAVRMARKAANLVPAALTLLFIAGFLPLVLGVILKSVETQTLKPNIRAGKKALEQAATLSQKIAELQDRVQKQNDTCRSLQTLTVREPLWAGVLNALSEAIPPDVMLTGLSTSLSPTGTATVNLNGRILASTRTFDDAMSAFLSNLSSSIFFGSVHISSATASSDGSRSGDFSIRCELVY
jgi:Tfp pilus assembly protein PilN